MPICVLNEMQKFNQQIPATRTITQKCFDLCPSSIVQLATFWGVTPFALAGFPDTALSVCCHFIPLRRWQKHIVTPHGRPQESDATRQLAPHATFEVTQPNHHGTDAI